MIFILVLILVATLVYFRLVKPLDYWQKRGVKQQNRLKAFLFNWFGLFRKESVTTYVQRMYDQFPNAKGWMYPTQVINERTCTESFTIQPESPGEKPFRIEKGVYVIFPSFAIQRDPTNFPNPDRFDPERFNNENKGKIVPQTYQPFGHAEKMYRSQIGFIGNESFVLLLVVEF
ncbi:hypothetical protein JTB14_037591 [Gonioctena quinquepunctata]|nr:hypothetical protein JTB14_037591 [Gonioctena quinquepunctata]